MAQDIVIGTELKFNMFIQPLDDIHAVGYNFSVKAYGNSKAFVLIQKDSCVYVDDDNYILPVDTSTLSPGALTLELTAYIPDSDFEDGLRTEIKRYKTDINLIQ